MYLFWSARMKGFTFTTFWEKKQQMTNWYFSSFPPPPPPQKKKKNKQKKTKKKKTGFGISCKLSPMVQLSVYFQGGGGWGGGGGGGGRKRSQCRLLKLLPRMQSIKNLVSVARIHEKKNSRSSIPFVQINPFMPSGFFYINSLDRFISNIRGVWLAFIIVMFCRNIWTMQTVKTLIRRRVLWRRIWVYTVCQCAFYGTLDLYGWTYLIHKYILDRTSVTSILWHNSLYKQKYKWFATIGNPVLHAQWIRVYIARYLQSIRPCEYIRKIYWPWVNCMHMGADLSLYVMMCLFWVGYLFSCRGLNQRCISI